MDFISIDENIFPIDWILFLSAVPVVSYFISIHDRIPENVEDAMIVEFSIVYSLKIYSYIGY